MWAETVAAASVGLSFGNSWLCILLSLGTRAHSKSLALWFILGRFLGIMGLGLIAALFGLFVVIPQRYFILTFAIVTVVFGLAILLQQYGWFSRIRFDRHGHQAPVGCAHKHDGSGPRGRGAKGGHNGPGHPTGSGPACQGGGIGGKGGFVFGLIRGATPCVKFLILVPLVLVFPLPQAMLLVFIFALTSTIYPVIGFLLGNVIVNLPIFGSPRKAAFRLAVLSSFILLGIGIYYLYKYLTFQCAYEGV
jgi:hypothetical protein